MKNLGFQNSDTVNLESVNRRGNWHTDKVSAGHIDTHSGCNCKPESTSCACADHAVCINFRVGREAIHVRDIIRCYHPTEQHGPCEVKYYGNLHSPRRKMLAVVIA